MNVVDRLSPHRSSRDIYAPRMIVVHGDAGKTDAGTLSWLQHPESRVSYHWFVGRDGTAYRVVDEAEKAWHAGVSTWPGLTVGNSVNPTSIGVCFANDGTEAYRDAQYETGGALIADAMLRYEIPLELIRGHYEVSPGRKTDPWPQFRWERLYGALGMHLSRRAA